MALKIKIKPHEKILVSGAVITNGGLTSTNLIIENNVPLLREKEILKSEKANTPARRIYFTVQLMYMDQNNLAEHHKSYWDLVNPFLKAAPSVLGLINKISEQILKGQYYNALKLARRLIEYEQIIKS